MSDEGERFLTCLSPTAKYTITTQDLQQTIVITPAELTSNNSLFFTRDPNYGILYLLLLHTLNLYHVSKDEFLLSY